jgi:uncharacterized membrane protein SpoIIM required for sporulation
MYKLKEEEQKKITAGFSITKLLSLAGITTFIIGLIDGYIRPLKCNS